MKYKYSNILFVLSLINGSCGSSDQDRHSTNDTNVNVTLVDTNSLDSSIASENIEETPKRSNIDLSAFEEIHADDKVELIKHLEFDYDYLSRNDENWAINATEVFHFFDLDNDGDMDAIYDGWSGGEPTIVRIYLNIEGTYKRVLNEVQYITDIQIENHVLNAISIWDPGCCDSYVAFHEDYIVHTSKDHMFFESIKRTAIIGDEPKPSQLLSEPICFVIDKDIYYLRSSPEIDTTELVIYDNYRRSDNIIAQYEKDAHGIAYAQTTDHTGRIWWFVEMDPDYYPVETEFYDYETEETYLLGWMSSRYLTVIKDETIL
ncbi:MAG: hypothetical protein R2780_05500 [Crocinitomicaceae bacterium]|nr:hypothetical protein [Crocinitomicaceae bacterium]